MPALVLTLYYDPRKVSERHAIQPDVYALGRLIEARMMGATVSERDLRPWGVRMVVEEDMDQGDE